MKVRDTDDLRYLLDVTGRKDENGVKLNPNQRIVVMVYASSEQRPDGTVMDKAMDLAELAGMSAPVFSRTRRELCEAGWLEVTGAFGQVKLYRLAPERFADRGPAGRHLRAVTG